MGYKHSGRHNLGPTWLGDPLTVVAMANATIGVMHHIITKEFEQAPGGGLVQKWYQVSVQVTCLPLNSSLGGIIFSFLRQGEGFPLWIAGMVSCELSLAKLSLRLSQLAPL